MPAHVKMLPICPFADGDSTRTQCRTCKDIENAGEKPWCYEWLRHLKDYSACLETEKAESDRQVRLMVDHADDTVIDIRYKLALLQTQTVRKEPQMNLLTFFPV